VQPHAEERVTNSDVWEEMKRRRRRRRGREEENESIIPGEETGHQKVGGRVGRGSSRRLLLLL
jgi:hypothetical protein